MIDHRRYARIRPYILGCFHHIYNGIDGQDDTQDGDGSAYARHQREGEEIATHGHTRIADGRDDGDENPQENGRPCERCTAILHHEE